MKTVGSRKNYKLLFGIILIISTVPADAQETSGPIINETKKEIILQSGQNYTLSCKGRRPVEFKQQSLGEESSGGSFFQTISRNTTGHSPDLQYPYQTELDLIDVDQYAVGYYACFDNAINSSEILNDIIEEPNNTEHVSYIYIYVEGTDYMIVPMGEWVIPSSKSKVVIGCRPTSPDVKFNLLVRSKDSTEIADYLKYSPKIGFLVRACRPSFTCHGQRGNETKDKIIRCTSLKVSKPKVTAVTKYFSDGDTFSLHCFTNYQKNLPVDLKWSYPSNLTSKKAIISTNELDVEENGLHYNDVTISNATRDDAGDYACIAEMNDNSERKTYRMIYIDKPFIHLKQPPSVRLDMDGHITARSKTNMRLAINIDAYPTPKNTFLRNGNVMMIDPPKYNVSNNFMGDIILTIQDLTVRDSANYTLVADNGAVKKTFTYDFRVFSPPEVNIKSSKIIRRDINQTITLNCSVTGYPLPNVRWFFNSTGFEETEVKESEHTIPSVYEVHSSIVLPVHKSGEITCVASNKIDTDSDSRQLYVYEIRNGFGIQDTPDWYPENDNVTLKCLASLYDYKNVTWLSGNRYSTDTVKYFDSPFSHMAVLKIVRVPQHKAGNYTCVGTRNDGENESRSIHIQVEVNRIPIITEPLEENLEVSIYQNVQFSCEADAVPPPDIRWYKDGNEVVNGTDGLEIKETSDRTVLNSTIIIRDMKEENKGKYECVANNTLSSESKFINLLVPAKPNIAIYLGIFGAIFFGLTLLVIYLTWKVKKEKRFRKELAKAGLLYFKEGIPKSLNPDLNIDEQAELLPYDERFEFPAEKLFLGKQLGAGAFGVVYKAEARGIVNAEETTTVAVKTVKKTADNMYIKALASELKIMVHLGKHVNIVNLLGACTKNIGKRELMVIVEYCRFGNIHNYLIRHREVFINQLTTDCKEKPLGRVNRGYSCSSAESGMQSDYGGSNHTQGTEHTFLNTANSTRKDKPNQQMELTQVSEGYVQPEWRTNYESDYQSAAPRPLFSRDLLAWAFQIARGMEYLASRKVLHGDLAARNIVLADDNIVKICDFGLARSIYKNDEYKKKSDSLLPVKWLAIECLNDRIFSTQSDVWSFGIVLWELFSLARTPYPSIPSPQDLLPFLNSGRRLEKPMYADERLYNVMLQCWEHKPTMRPNFTQLQETLGSFLEDNVRNHYVDLNSTYMDLNAKNAGQEDYLDMMNAPDYLNQVTPSPHHYQNGPNEIGQSFFPPSPGTLPQAKGEPEENDQDGYLQMTPVNKSLSPMSESNKFDFDARKVNRNSPLDSMSYGSESTPMLTLNNLPARSGSESDLDGGHSPYLTMCPRIDEEADEVFDTNTNNAKNALNHNGAVTNPTYITFGLDDEKKSQNTYINVPNGLVK
ncbi:vascular endothelial growth factor receptor 1 isoform X3 [Plodia interpunctella]|uniref:vascular endothelial growth factor receptor 1 isoform X3 n=1 Tax=Plodia interpunctella TaxID=58824 RepID=UPI002368487F|nr:vascular endothelial growth factor receptor 1 isoform X3 [Plodia interpunctella]